MLAIGTTEPKMIFCLKSNFHVSILGSQQRVFLFKRNKTDPKVGCSRSDKNKLFSHDQNIYTCTITVNINQINFIKWLTPNVTYSQFSHSYIQPGLVMLQYNEAYASTQRV